VKQSKWTEQVENAIKNVKNEDHQLNALLTRILGFTNIPRKEEKFVNFLKNSIKVRDESLCRSAWKAISEEATKAATNGTTPKPEPNLDNAMKSVPPKKSVHDERANGNHQQGTNGSSLLSEESSPNPFKWKATIKRKLKSADGEMKLKTLRLEVCREFCDANPAVECNAAELKEIFDAKLSSTGVVVEGKIAKLSKT
jgi:cell growth-regulating nucleolar protein